MHRPVTPERRTQFRGIHHGRRRQLAPERAQSAAAAFGAIKREQQRPRLTSPHRLGDPLEAGNRAAGAACKAKRFAAAPSQQGLNAVRKIRRHRHHSAGRSCEKPLARRPLHYIALRGQPQTPPRQPSRDIGHQLAVGTGDKAQQAGAFGDCASDDAPPLRAGVAVR